MKKSLLMIAILVMPMPCLAVFAEAAVDFKEGRYEAALETLAPLARNGDPSAQYLMGRMHHDGLGVPKDQAKAREFFEAAAGHGNAAAQCALGTIYYRGEGVSKDVAKSAAWFQRAADQGSTHARARLGWLYEWGEGVPQDREKAKALGVKNDGSFLLFLINECGSEQPKNAQEISARRFEEAIERGDPLAEFRRGYDFYTDEKFEDAVYWFRKAAEHGQVDAQFALGRMYLEGKHVVRDTAQATLWLEQAAEQWDLIAMHMLARMNLERDPARAYMYGYLLEIARKPDAAPPTSGLVERMTPIQIADGNAAVREFLSRNPRPADAARRSRFH
jgi:TPR repeat protein